MASIAASPAPAGGAVKPSGGGELHRNEKSRSVRHQNIVAAKILANAIHSSLGPRGMDKMIQDAKDNVVITNDGATILKEMNVVHPVARMLVELSRAQDIEAGDGTTTVVVIAAAMLEAASQLLERGVHAQAIAEAYLRCSDKAQEVLRQMAQPIDITDKDRLVRAATTSLSSKVVSQNAAMLAPMAVEAVLQVIDPNNASASPDIDLHNIRVVKKLGGTVEDSELVPGLVFTQQKVSRAAGGPTRIVDAKIGLIQFCLSTPKTDMENSISIKDYQAIDRLLREERLYTARMCKAIAKTGCNVLLVQKSILRDAVTDLSLDYLAKLGVLVIRDIERDDVEFISKTLNCEPVASIDHFTEDRLGQAALVTDERSDGAGRVTRITGVPGKSTVTVLCRASNSLVLEETERSFHDALCVVRSIVRTRALLPGGGAPEVEVALQLRHWARELPGNQSLCAQAFADALEVIPYTLAENCGLNAIEIVTHLRAKHLEGCTTTGVDVKRGQVGCMVTEDVIQPLLTTASAIRLATETVMVILKVDDIVITR